MVEHLATVEGTLADLRFAIRQTALAGDDGPGTVFNETLLRVRDGILDTPAGSLSNLPGVYTRFTDDFFDEINVHTDSTALALVNLQDLQKWLEKFPQSTALAVKFFGDEDTRVTERLVFDAEIGTITLKGINSRERIGDIDIEMPDCFVSGRFHSRSDQPAPTIARTTGGSLEQIADMVETLGQLTYPLHVEESGPIIDMEWDGVHVETNLPGALIEGDPVYNEYGSAFAATARSLSGKIRVETGPGHPTAFIRDGEGYTIRVILDRVERFG